MYGVDKKYYIIAITVLTGSYAVYLTPSLESTDDYPDYYYFVLPFYLECESNEFPEKRNPISWWFRCFSYQTLGNDRIIPIVASIAHVPLCYILGSSIIRDRRAGLVASIAFVFNPIVLLFDDSTTYDQVWSLFLLLSILSIYLKPLGTIPFYILSILAKGYAFAFLPMMLYHNIKEKRKLCVYLLIALGVGFAIFVYFDYNITGNPIGFYPDRMIDGLVRIFETLWPVLPWLGLFVVIDYMFKGKFEGKDVCKVWMLGIIGTIPMIYLFTFSQDMYAYRMWPFVIFMSIYIGGILVKVFDWYIRLRERKQSSFIRE